MKNLLTIVIALLLSLPCFSQVQYTEKVDIPNAEFFSKLVKVQLDMPKDSVLSILGGPYKVFSIKTSGGNVYEAFSYRTYMYNANNNAPIVYSFIFRNSKLIMIHEDEHFRSESCSIRSGGLDLWEIARKYNEVH